MPRSVFQIILPFSFFSTLLTFACAKSLRFSVIAVSFELCHIQYFMNLTPFTTVDSYQCTKMKSNELSILSQALIIN